MTARLSGDRPISHPQDDAFGLSSFAEALATSLLQMSPKDGLVISVEGPWGAGKSSAIALAIRTIMLRVLNAIGLGLDDLEALSEADLLEVWERNAKHRRTHLVRFNPWNFTGQENLVRAFFAELSTQLDIAPDGWWKKPFDRLAGYLPAFLGGAATGGALLAAGPLPGIAAAAGTVGRAVGEMGQKAFANDTSVEKAKKNLAKALRQADQRIIVVIDDLDRLMPSEMRAMFSLVKSLGDLPNVLYLLSFDDKIVHKALGQNAEKIDPEFLEKIVQVSLKLPPPWRYELHHFLTFRLNAVIGDATPADENRWREMIRGAVDPYLQTPRDVTRLVNTLQVIWPNVDGEVDLADMVALTTLQLFDPPTYALIRDEIESITYADYGYEDDKEFAKRLEPLSAKKPEAAKEAMALLFPRLAKAWGKFSVDNTVYLMQKAHRRICTKEYHRNYFVFGRDSRMISRAELERIIISSDPSKALGAALKRVADDNPTGELSGTARLLVQIGEMVYQKPLLSGAFVRALLDHSDYLLGREDELWDFIVTKNDDRIRQILLFGILKLEQPTRAEILDILVNYAPGLQTRADTIEADARRHGLIGNEPKDETDRLFNANMMEPAVDAIREQVIRACLDGTMWQMPRPLRLVWTWRRFTDSATVKPWFDQAIADDAQVIKLANELPSRMYRSNENGTSMILVYEPARFEDVIDPEVLMGRLRDLAVENPDAANALEQLRAAEKASRD